MCRAARSAEVVDRKARRCPHRHLAASSSWPANAARRASGLRPQRSGALPDRTALRQSRFPPRCGRRLHLMMAALRVSHSAATLCSGDCRPTLLFCPAYCHYCWQWRSRAPTAMRRRLAVQAVAVLIRAKTVKVPKPAGSVEPQARELAVALVADCQLATVRAVLVGALVARLSCCRAPESAAPAAARPMALPGECWLTAGCQVVASKPYWTVPAAARPTDVLHLQC